MQYFLMEEQGELVLRLSDWPGRSDSEVLTAVIPSTAWTDKGYGGAFNELSSDQRTKLFDAVQGNVGITHTPEGRQLVVNLPAVAP
jgi:hypothetical protein